MLEQQFDEYKAEFSRLETTAERKNELIVLMQANLRERNNQDNRIFVCLDGQEYSIDSENVEHLYAINGLFRYQERENQLSAIGNRGRLQAQNRNNYDPNNPYPNN